MNAYKLISAVFEIKELVEEESTDGNWQHMYEMHQGYCQCQTSFLPTHW